MKLDAEGLRKTLKIRNHLKDLSIRSYLKEDAAERSRVFLDCSLGVNCLGASKKVLQTARAYDWSKIWRYPDPTYADLKEKISAHWSEWTDLKPEQIQIGHGASAILEGLYKLIMDPGDRALGYSPQWVGFRARVEVMGGRYEVVPLHPEEAFKFNAGRFVSKITAEYSLLLIDNPINPTGQLIPLSEIEEILIRAKKKGVAVAVDEAYGDYVENENSAIRFANKFNNLIVIRSFSKGYGLAGMRIGYGVFEPKLARFYDKIDLPVPVSEFASSLAITALSDRDFIRGCRKSVLTEKTKLIKGLIEKGYVISQTHGSCPIFLLGHKEATLDMKRELLEKGILTMGGDYYQEVGKNYVRVSIPKKAEDFFKCL